MKIKIKKNECTQKKKKTKLYKNKQTNKQKLNP